MAKPYANSQQYNTNLNDNHIIGVQIGNATDDQGLPQMKYITLGLLKSYVMEGYGYTWTYRGEYDTALPTDLAVNDYFLCTGTFTQDGQTFYQGRLYAWNGSVWSDITLFFDVFANKVTGATTGDLASLKSDGDLEDSGIPKTAVGGHLANTDIHVTTSDKSAWNAKYDKPSGGIPKTDLANGVQTSLGKADTAYQLPSGGMPKTDMASAVQTSLGKADTAYQKPSGGIPSNDMTTAVQTSLGKADSAYQKPSTGIPKTDLASGVQTSLGLADSAYQKPSTGIPKTDMATAVQTSLGKADSAYQKPSGGIPNTDMTSSVQTSLGLADSAYQKPSTGIPKTDMASAVQTSLGKADTAYQLPSGGVPKTDMASAVQTSLGKADSALQTSDIYDGLDSTATNKALSAKQGKAVNDKVVAIEGKIPSQASSSNQLADKAFVNSSIATNTANYISNNGQPFTSLAQLQAYTGTVTNNDYAFVTGTDSGGNSYYDRYKASVSGSTVTWSLEYRLNNSSFTAVQWDAINSGITDLLVTSYSNHVADTDIHVTTSNKSAWNAKYDKPSGGIPKTDMASAVQTSLGKADSAYQLPSGGVPKTDLASGVQTSLGLADSAYQKPSGGIPKTDMASAVQTSLGKADSAYQKPSGGIPSTDLASAVQTSLGKADSALQTGDIYDGLDSSSTTKALSAKMGKKLNDDKYQKPSGGIPKTDLASAVQTSLGLADSAYQKPSGGIPSTDMTSAVTTSLGKADTAYQKPSGGIPKTDLASAVQTSLGKADTAYQKPSGGIPSTDMTSAVTTSLGKADTAYQKPSGGIPKTDLASAVQTSLGKADSALQSVSFSQITGQPQTNTNLANAFKAMTGSTAYSTSTSYAVGDYCIYNNGLKRCTTATSGTFNPSHWIDVTIEYVAENSGGNDVGLSVVNGMVCITYTTT